MVLVTLLVLVIDLMMLVEAGIRARLIQHPLTVEGFARAIRKHLDEQQPAELKGQSDRIAPDLTRHHALLKSCGKAWAARIMVIAICFRESSAVHIWASGSVSSSGSGLALVSALVFCRSCSWRAQAFEVHACSKNAAPTGHAPES